MDSIIRFVTNKNQSQCISRMSMLRTNCVGVLFDSVPALCGEHRCQLLFKCIRHICHFNPVDTIPVDLSKSPICVRIYPRANILSVISDIMFGTGSTEQLWI